MSRLISSINVTPDGFCEHSDVIADEEHHQFATGLLRNADILLLGRNTYQLFEDYWPQAARDTTLPKPMIEFAHLLNGVNKVVASKTMKKAKWEPTKILHTIETDSIRMLKQEARNNILIFGSPGLVSELTKLHLIDEYFFSVQPIISGKGKRLFDGGSLAERQDLKHVDTIRFKSGVVTLHYSNANGLPTR